MALITLPTDFTDGTIPTAAQFDGNFNVIVNEINGNLDNSNVKSSAGIAESKIAFNGSGHGHTGGSDGKLIPKNRAYGFYIAGTPSVANDLSWNPRAYANQTVTRLSAHVKTAPTGADLIIRVWNVTTGATVGSVTISAGSTDATTTSITNSTITAGDILRIDVTQVGSTVAGADITTILDVSE